MGPIIVAFIKLMGAAIGTWCLLGGSQGQALCAWQSHKNVTFSAVRHAWLPIWLRPLIAKRANNQGGNAHIILLHRLC